MQFEPFTLSNAEHVLIHDVQAKLSDGRITVLLGLNGSGKSTLLNRLAQQQPQNIAYLPQRNHIYDALTVQALLDLASERATQVLSVDVIEQLGLRSLLTRDMQQLSGGQQQRVWLAFTFLQNRAVVLLDEPMTGLDLVYQQALLRLMRQLAQQGTTFLTVLHDVNQAGAIADDIWYITEQTLVSGTADQLLNSKMLKQVLQVELVAIDNKFFQPKAF